MVEKELIRRMVLVDGMSQREAAKLLGHSRKTITKALDDPQVSKYELKQPRNKPQLVKVQAIIEAWLEEDLRRPRKQRHTAQKIHQRLRDDYGYDGSYSSVARHVARWKQEQGLIKEVFMPLVFAPGEEAQIDWGEASVLFRGKERKLQFFCLKLAYSKRRFVRAYLHAKLEAFLDGHVRALAHLGGVPRRLAYDNLKAAVIRVGRGRERDLNRRFVELRSWYLFESRFCNVAKGNEKGHAENLVKQTQRDFLTPVPDVSELEELNDHLLRVCDAQAELWEPDGRSRRALWEEELACLSPLPPQAFPACIQRSSSIDKFSLVRHDNRWYSAPVRYAYQKCEVRAYVAHVEIYCGVQRVATHPRSYGAERFVLQPEHYLPLLAVKPGALHNGRPFAGEPFGADFSLLRRELEYRYGEQGTRQYIRVLLLLTEHPQDEVRQAVRQCVQQRAFQEQAVLHALRHPGVCAVASKRLDLSHRPELAGVEDGVRSASLYDQLLQDSTPVAPPAAGDSSCEDASSVSPVRDVSVSSTPKVKE